MDESERLELAYAVLQALLDETTLHVDVIAMVIEWL